MLDSRAPATYQCLEEEKKREEEAENQVQCLMREARLWRVANSAQWVAWGIVQATVEGMDETLEIPKAQNPSSKDASAADFDNIFPNEPVTNEVEESFQPQPHSESPPYDSDSSPTSLLDDSKCEEEASEANEEEEFDYLGYAQERAMLFWGDVLDLGLVKREDLPEDLLRKIKVVKY